MSINPQQIKIEDFDYNLSDEKIAKHPLKERDASKLLVYNEGSIYESVFCNISEYLPKNSLLVFNDTKVIQARLKFFKETGSSIEIFCLEPWQIPASIAFEQREKVTWKCFVGNNKRWKSQILEKKIQINGIEVKLKVERLKAIQDAWIVEFTWNGGFSFAEIMENAGLVPLPPYLHREVEAGDRERYQTIYAHYNGSVAAPTAGLHFTDKVFKSLKKENIETEFITLHVGAGTFKPVSTDFIGEHEMHREKVFFKREQIEHILLDLRRPVIAVGTTTVRSLESLYWFGVQLEDSEKTENMQIGQWFPYSVHKNLDAGRSLENVLNYMDKHFLTFLEGETKLMIAPSYKYRIVNGLVTNFHQPKSTLLLLVAAMIGDEWKKAYEFAVNHNFRFLSYGDSCLFLPKLSQL